MRKQQFATCKCWVCLCSNRTICKHRWWAEFGLLVAVCQTWCIVLVIPKKSMARNSAAAAKSLQSCPTLCDPIDGSPPGFPVPGILQARTLEWVAISFSNAWKWKVKVKSLSRVRLATPWTAAYQAPPSRGFSREEYWSGVPLPSPPGTLGNIEFFCFRVVLLNWLLLDIYMPFIDRHLSTGKLIIQWFKYLKI